MSHRPSLAFFIMLFLAAAAHAAEPVSEARIFKDEKGRTLRYRLIKPVKGEKERLYPLVIHLHGAGERGEDNEKQLVHFFAPGKGLGKVAVDKHHCFAFVPQCPPDQQWVNVPWKDGSYEQKPISDALDLALKAMDQVIKEHPIHEGRIYITGLSMGGFGTWDAILRRPGFFAAAVPICGAGDPGKAKTITQTPVWAWHGDADNVVPVSGSRDMIEAITKAGGQPKYTELKKVGHNSWAPAYDSAEMWDWMFNQQRVVKK